MFSCQLLPGVAITNLQSLTKEDLVRIMVEPKNALCKQYQSLLGMDGVSLEITDGALQRIAEKALEREIGARGLRAIMERIMTSSGIMPNFSKSWGSTWARIRPTSRFFRLSIMV